MHFQFQHVIHVFYYELCVMLFLLQTAAVKWIAKTLSTLNMMKLSTATAVPKQTVRKCCHVCKCNHKIDSIMTTTCWNYSACEWIQQYLYS